MLELFTVIAIVLAVVCALLGAVAIFPAIDEDDIEMIEEFDEPLEILHFLWDARWFFYPAVGFTALACVLVVAR